MNDCGVARPLVLVLEGVNDCEFLFRLSQRLHAENPQLANLTRLHADGRILLVPTGGGNFDQWAVRLQPWVAGIPPLRSRNRSRNTPAPRGH